MVRIGKIVATHGLQGSLVLSHIVGDDNWLKKDDALFVEIRKGSNIPYFVVSAKAANDEEQIVQLEEVTTVEEAKKLIGKQVYVDTDVLKTVTSNTPLLWIGFNMVDKQKGGLGLIEDVVQVGPQWLAKLIIEGHEVLVPLVDDFIVDVNTRNKFIRVDLPDGLLEIYLDKKGNE